MRIKSPWVDYYDKCQFPGTDDQLYVRYPQEVTNIPLIHSTDRNWHPTWGYDKITIGFCGKVYLGYRFRSPDHKTKYLYTVDEVRAFYESMNWKWPKSYFYGKSYDEKYDDISKLDLDDHFRRYMTPIMVCNQSRVGWHTVGKYRKYLQENITTINGRLRDFNFQTVFSPQEAYQEISMFLGNMASPEKPIPKIDDVTMAYAKGFDKYSFRKDKAKK